MYGDTFFEFDPFFGAFNFGFIFIAIIFVLVIGTIIVRLVRGGIDWNRNNNSPILTVTAEIVNLRQEVDSHHTGDSHHHTTTDYYASFQVESGDRMELSISGKEYGQLAIGDVGRLTFQGTRYKGFQRY